MEPTNGDRLEQASVVIRLSSNENFSRGTVREVHDDQAANRGCSIIGQKRTASPHRIEMASNELAMSVGNLRSNFGRTWPVDHVNREPGNEPSDHQNQAGTRSFVTPCRGV